MKTKRGKFYMPNAVNSVFYVNNDPKGLKFLKDLKSHLNGANYKIRLMGRNSDRVTAAKKSGRRLSNVQQSMRRSESTYFAVYVDPVGRKKEIEDEFLISSWDNLRSVQEANERQVNRIRELEREVAELRQGLVNAQVQPLPGRKFRFVDDLPS